MGNHSRKLRNLKAMNRIEKFLEIMASKRKRRKHKKQLAKQK
jgi:hypothetical protein